MELVGGCAIQYLAWLPAPKVLSLVVEIRFGEIELMAHTMPRQQEPVGGKRHTKEHPSGSV